MMKTRAAVLRQGGQPWEITELDVDEPKAGEVLIRYEAAGLCHSDEHIRATGTARLPLVGGHEGAGVIEATGPGVTRVTTGDRVACSYIPVCGTCRYCSTGHQNLCDAGKNAAIGCLTDGTFRFHTPGASTSSRSTRWSSSGSRRWSSVPPTRSPTRRRRTRPSST
jgi:alcohol dehydrogenase (nicotinoprotein)